MTIYSGSQLLTVLFFTAMAVAGAAVLWRNWLADHPRAERGIRAALGGYNKVLLCGSCFTYWLSLAAVCMLRPFDGLLAVSVPGGVVGSAVVHAVLSWMSIAWAAVFLRFAYVALQELVHYQVHHMKDGH